MMTFLLPFLAFMAVVLIMLLIYGIWTLFFDPRKKAQNKRMQSVQKTVHGEGIQTTTTSIGQTTTDNSVVKEWLESRSEIFKKLEKLLQRADSPLNVVQFVGIMIFLFLLILVLGIWRETNPLLLIVLASAIACTPLLWLSRKINQKSKAIEDKLPDTLEYISRALRAGHSFSSAINEIGRDFPPPIGREFKTVSDEISFGISFRDAFSHLAERTQSNDINFFVVSIIIQHETGGNLVETLEKLSNTIRERAKLRGKIRTLSAEGRASAWILGAMPFVFAVIMMLLNPGYISLLWETPQGHNLIFICLGLMIIGIFVIRRIVQIKV